MPSTPLRLSSAAALLLAFVAALPGQSPYVPNTVPEPLTPPRTGSLNVLANRPRLESPPEAYTLGPGDLLSIQVLEADSAFGEPLRISISGSVHAPMAGRIPAAGRTVDEFEADLTERLKAYVRDPHVAVNVVEYRSRPVTVIGAVRNPGVQVLSGDQTLLEVLSQAG
jgi:protein involved in polysaccharide export with SLBB domain